jgi:hypothetical protein
MCGVSALQHVRTCCVCGDKKNPTPPCARAHTDTSACSCAHKHTSMRPAHRPVAILKEQNATRTPTFAQVKFRTIVLISCAARTGGRLTERRNLARRLLAGAEGSHAPPGLAGALQREKPRAPPAGGRRGLVGLLAHTYTTCAVMSGLDKDRRSILTIMFVRDSCSKQLDSNRLAADVPDINTSESIGVFYCPNR